MIQICSLSHITLDPLLPMSISFKIPTCLSHLQSTDKLFSLTYMCRLDHSGLFYIIYNT